MIDGELSDPDFDPDFLGEDLEDAEDAEADRTEDESVSCVGA